MNSRSYKKSTLEFLQLVIAGEIRQAYDQYVAMDFRHHNTFFHGDRESLMVAMEESDQANPHKEFEVKRVIAEDELVAVHSYVKKNAEDLGVALIHIFRFKDDKIVELWDLGQKIPEDSINENGIF